MGDLINLGCNCCDEFVSECANEDTTPFEGVQVSDVPTTLTVGPFTIPDFNGTYLFTAAETCPVDAGDVPLPIFGNPTEPDCCIYDWNVSEVQTEELDDFSCEGLDATNVRLECTWGMFMQIQYSDADTIEYAFSISVRVKWKADLDFGFGAGPATVECSGSAHLIRNPSITFIDNVAGSIVNPTPFTIVAESDGEYSCDITSLCELDAIEGIGNWAVDDDWEITLEWV